MIKSMFAKYAGVCSVSGASINPGDSIRYDTVSRKAWLHEPGDMENPFGVSAGISRVTLDALKYIAPVPFYQQTFSRRSY